ncbi:hypothetical protein WJX73_010049 [Symbiochloris irregularis]|uniref:Pinin/SDK/MemA protein domain-containing protein n=1 Tax=Symbiochloris irregularis TaxID=706552 RepID=A0AAW1P3Q9_9CHLO
MAADIQQLTAELNTISQQRYEIDEKLRSYNRGRGRGRGGLAGRGSFDSRPSLGASDVSQLPARPSYEQDRLEARPQSRSRFADRLGPPNVPSTSERHTDAERNLPPPPTRVMSAVVIDGETRPSSHSSQSFADLAGSKRPRELADDNPDTKKRNRRLFGSLLGTLQKFKQEDTKFRDSKVAQQRAEALQRAEARAAEEQVKAKEAQRQAFLAQRQAEINRKRELSMQVEIKRLEIALMQRIMLREQHVGFLKTTAGPPVMWLPSSVNATLQQLLDHRLSEFTGWKDQQIADFEAEKQRRAERLKQIISGPHAATEGATGVKSDASGEAPAEPAEEDAELSDAEGSPAQNGHLTETDRHQGSGEMVAGEDGGRYDGMAGMDQDLTYEEEELG